MKSLPPGVRVYFRPAWWLTLLLAFLFFIFIWPGEYTYQHDKGRLIRIHRFTEEIDILTPNGFRPWDTRLRDAIMADSLLVQPPRP